MHLNNNKMQTHTNTHAIIDVNHYVIGIRDTEFNSVFSGFSSGLFYFKRQTCRYDA